MTEEYWVAVLKEEDRLLSNSDRKYRYHCNSLESMSEELTFQERCFYIQEDFTVQCEIRDFIDTIQNERLAEGLRHLTDRQRQVIELYFWKGYQCKEIATMFGCSPAAVTDLMHRVYKQLRVYLMDRVKATAASHKLRCCRYFCLFSNRVFQKISSTP